MRYQAWGFSLSFLLHLMAVIALSSLGYGVVPKQRIVIDFSINSSPYSEKKGGNPGKRMEAEEREAHKKSSPVKPKAAKKTVPPEKMATDSHRLKEVAFVPEKKIPPEKVPEKVIKKEAIEPPVKEVSVPEEKAVVNNTQKIEEIPMPVEEPSVNEPLEMASVATLEPDEVISERASIPQVAMEDAVNTAEEGDAPSLISSFQAGDMEDTAGPGTGDVDSQEHARERYLKEHFSYIREKIQKSVCYPKIARRMGWTGRVTVSFVIYKDGRVDDIDIVESSGISILDKDAVDTIQKVSPFPDPPVEARIVIPIVYKLN